MATTRPERDSPEWGYWEWDPSGDCCALSSVVRAALDRGDGPETTREQARAAMAPEQWAELEAIRRRLIAGEIETASHRFTLDRPDGSVCFAESHYEAIRAADGRLIKIRGTTRDITQTVELNMRVEEAEAGAQSTIDSLPANVAILDGRGVIVSVNRAWRDFAAACGAGSDFVGDDYIAICAAVDDSVAQASAAGLRRVLAGELDSFELEYPCHGPSERHWALMRVTRCAGADPVRVVVMHEDVTAQHELRKRALAQETLLDRLNAAVTIVDAEGRLVRWNKAAEQLHGWTESEVLGQVQLELLDPIDLASGDRPTFGARAGSWDGEFSVRHRNGTRAPVYVRLHAMTDDDGVQTGLASVAIDLSERKAYEHEIARAHNYIQALADGVGDGLFALDVDGRVTYMNDAAQELLGWSIDELEGQVMHPITHGRRADGSELPIEECPISAARRDGSRVLVDDDIFIRADGSELPVRYSATPFATSEGIEGCVVVFSDISERRAAEQAQRREEERRSWVNRVQQALAADGFQLHGQPILDLQSNEVVQQELLIRMLPTDGSGSLISPGLFLPAAEESGLIAGIDRWVIDRAVELAGAGQPVELNVSAVSISDPSLVDYIRRALARSGADPAALVFEITETTLISDEAAARAFVEGLHRLGCKIALDDFGTGYGGFTYLKQLPIDYLKIDIEFVRDLKYDPASRNVVEAVVNLARGFGLITVGEGVEDQETLELLRELGVDRAQGFHLGRPAPIEPAHGALAEEL